MTKAEWIARATAAFHDHGYAMSDAEMAARSTWDQLRELHDGDAKVLGLDPVQEAKRSMEVAGQEAKDSSSDMDEPGGLDFAD